MPAQGPGIWLNRVTASLRDHEVRRSALQNSPSRYEIIEELSRGGMGIVYRAWDPQLGREVALKVLRQEEGISAEVHERFAREARLAASLHHPHIVPVHDTGDWNGQDYIAMQLIQGTTLDRAKLDRRAALAAIRDAARALHYAHEQGVVHRDVKPSNLMLDGSGRVYVTDFGVARKVEVASNFTNPGTIIGTPAYMSPEQAQGLEADAQSDVYSLGATLYDLVTGRPPYTGRDSMEIVEAVRSREPLAPRMHVRDLSRNVDAVILTAMDRDRRERYPTAAALADDIDLYLANQRPKCRPRGTFYRIRRVFVRHPWRLTAAVVFVALVALSAVAAGFWVRAHLYLKRGLEEADPRRRKEYFQVAAPFFAEADRELETIRNRERIAEIDRIVAEQAAKTRKAQEEARQAAEKSRNEDAEKYKLLMPKLRQVEFEAHLETLYDTARKGEADAFKKLLDGAGTAYDSVTHRRALLAGPAVLLAEKLLEKSLSREAATWFDEAEKYLTQAIEQDPKNAGAYHDRGRVRCRARERVRETLEDLTQAVALDPKIRIDPIYDIAAIDFSRRQMKKYGMEEDPKTREDAWREATRFLSLVAKSSNEPDLFLERAGMHYRLADYKSAREDALRAGETVQALRLRGKIAYGTAVTQGNDRKGLEEALGSFNRAVASDPKDALSLYWRGTCRNVLKDYAAALEDLTAAAGLGYPSPFMDYQLSLLYGEIKEPGKAVEHATRALENAATLSEEDALAAHYEDKRLAWSAAIRLFKRDVYLARGQAYSAREEFRKCSDDCAEAIRLDPQYPAAWLWRGVAECGDKRHKEAQEDFRRVMSDSTSVPQKETAKRLMERCLTH